MPQVCPPQTGKHITEFGPNLPVAEKGHLPLHGGTIFLFMA